MISGQEWGEAGLKGMKVNFLFIERDDFFLEEEMHTVSHLLFS